MTDPATLHAHPRPQPDPAAVRTVVCYTRTANAGKSGQRLLGRQRAGLEAEVVFRGWTVAAWVGDLHQSGTTLRRPGLQQALALLAAGQAGALLAADMTRLAVDPAVASQLAALADRGGWQLVTLVTLDRHPRPCNAPRRRRTGGAWGSGCHTTGPHPRRLDPRSHHARRGPCS